MTAAVIKGKRAQKGYRWISLSLLFAFVVSLIWSNSMSAMNTFTARMKQSSNGQVTTSSIAANASIERVAQLKSETKMFVSSNTSMALLSPKARDPRTEAKNRTFTSNATTTQPPKRVGDTQQMPQNLTSKFSNDTSSYQLKAVLIPATSRKNETVFLASQKVPNETVTANHSLGASTASALPAQSMKAETSIEASPKEDPEAVFMRVTEPWSNVSTMTYYQHKFYSGYRNQMMSFTVFVMEAARQNISQILLASLLHRDTYGSNRMVCHQYLFDVVHWNSQYPSLPRLVRWDPVIHDQIDYRRYRPKFHLHNPELNSTRPVVYGRQARLMVRYKMYSKGRGEYATPHFRNPVELTMIRGGMRPHPDLQDILDKLLLNASMAANTAGGTSNNRSEYMTLHARVEPDMQAHSVCVASKERNLSQIFKFVEQKFPDPPAPLVFMPINRQEMEKVAKEERQKPRNEQNMLAIENLDTLNMAVKAGLWNGRARIIEFGSHSLTGTTYESRRSIAGSILNFYIALGGNIFVGTEVSSYSSDLVTSRFYRGEMRNYNYLPEKGLVEWTPKGMVHAPDFHC